MGLRWFVTGISLATVALLLVVYVKRSSPRAAISAKHSAPSLTVTHDSSPDRNRARPFEHNVIHADKLGLISVRELSDTLRHCQPREREELAGELEKMRPGVQQIMGVEQLFRAWAEVDPEAALSRAVSFSDLLNLRLALDAIAENITPDAAEKLAKDIVAAPGNNSSKHFRLEFLSRAVTRWSQSDPVAAAHFYEQHHEADDGELLRNPGTSSFLAAHIAQNWALIDPEAAMQWARQQFYRVVAMQGAIAGWWEANLQEATTFAKAATDNEEQKALFAVLDSKIATYSLILSRTDPNAGLDYAGGITNPQWQHQAKINIFKEWLERDNATARKALNESDLPAEMKTKVLSMPANP